MAVGDWNHIHTGYEFWYPDVENQYRSWIWNSTSFYRYGEYIVTLAKGPSDSDWHLYYFDQYSIGKLVDLSVIWSHYGFQLESFVKLGDNLFISGGKKALLCKVLSISPPPNNPPTTRVKKSSPSP